MGTNQFVQGAFDVNMPIVGIIVIVALVAMIFLAKYAGAVGAVMGGVVVFAYGIYYASTLPNGMITILIVVVFFAGLIWMGIPVKIHRNGPKSSIQIGGKSPQARTEWAQVLKDGGTPSRTSLSAGWEEGDFREVE